MKTIHSNKIEFRPLSLSDIPLIHQWFNLPHVKEFYSLRNWTEDEVLKKLQPYILNEKPVKYIWGSSAEFVGPWRLPEISKLMI